MTIENILSSPDITELAKAMVRVQQALVPACKDSENPFVKNRYASLNSVIDACRDALIERGIWVVQHPIPAEPGHLGLVTKLVHSESGQWQSSVMMMPLPKSDPQGYGSALTYARRYGLATLVGLVVESDDDAEGAMPRQRPKTKPRPSAQNDATPNDPTSGLPRLDGVRYQTVTANNGRLCVTASGNVRDKKAFLEQAGFRWDDTRNIWWRYAPEQAA